MVTGILFETDCKNKLIVANRENVLKLLGYTDIVDEHVKELVIDLIQLSKANINPWGGFVLKQINKVVVPEGKIYIDDLFFEVNKTIAAQLRKAEYLAFFICTIGNSIERTSKEYLSKGDLLEGYIFDLIGSESAENLAEVVHQEVMEYAQSGGLQISNRYSPGYCNWDVSEQFKLFSLFPSEQIKIKLTDSALMNPIKSVSGIIGIGRDLKFKPYSCKLCSDEKCIYRNKK
ncbi:MAG: methionine synthase [Bacteroidales bacterium]|nr:methionine synthase [Bacteroidales bacterium]MBN2820522.1 methionine synthase [Bacteroidales bacterium]